VMAVTQCGLPVKVQPGPRRTGGAPAGRCIPNALERRPDRPRQPSRKRSERSGHRRLRRLRGHGDPGPIRREPALALARNRNTGRRRRPLRGHGEQRLSESLAVEQLRSRTMDETSE
jgi:hypothetical protein